MKMGATVNSTGHKIRCSLSCVYFRICTVVVYEVVVVYSSILLLYTVVVVYEVQCPQVPTSTYDKEKNRK